VQNIYYNIKQVVVELAQNAKSKKKH